MAIERCINLAFYAREGRKNRGGSKGKCHLYTLPKKLLERKRKEKGRKKGKSKEKGKEKERKREKGRPAAREKGGEREQPRKRGRTATVSHHG